MGYIVKFHREARRELDNSKATYGEKFSVDMDAWIARIANSSTSHVKQGELDFSLLLEEGISTDANTWRENWRRMWADAGLAGKAKFVLATMRRRQLPLQIRVTQRWFTGILGQFDCEVEVYYEINHVEKRVTFIKFSGLPGGE
ncbi:MAG: hypothetical protein KDA60_00935 [Planctomycetales bacterium]|nr:hypothetical protein [Planctomycetales bacterium]